MRNVSIVTTIAASAVIAFAMVACTTVPIKPNCLRIEDTTRTHGLVCDETEDYVTKRSTVGAGGSGSGGYGNPGNDKGVGGAGESPNNGGGWGNGSKGKSQ